MRMSATIKVEFEAHEGQPENVLRAALQRGLGELRRGIEYESCGFRSMSPSIPE